MIKKILIAFFLLPFFFSISANCIESEWQFTENAKLRIIEISDPSCHPCDFFPSEKMKYTYRFFYKERS